VPELWTLGVIERMSKKFIFALAAIAAVVLAVGIPNFIRARSTSSAAGCINNLRQIDAAKYEWMYEKNKTTNDVPTWDDIRPYMAHELHCPAGGIYTIGRVGEPTKCSIGGPQHTSP